MRQMQRKILVGLPNQMLDEVDSMVTKRGYGSRCELIRAAVRRHLLAGREQEAPDAGDETQG